MSLTISVDLSKLPGWSRDVDKTVRRAARMAGRDAIKAMRAEGSRRIRATKAMKVSAIGKALTLVYPTNKEILIWKVKASGSVMPVSAFPYRQTKAAGRDTRTGRYSAASSRKNARAGVYVTINQGTRSFIPGAFVATLNSGHVGIFRRTGKGRLPIRELFTTRVSEAFSDALPAVATRGVDVFRATFSRVMRSGAGARPSVTAAMPDGPSGGDA